MRPLPNPSLTSFPFIYYIIELIADDRTRSLRLCHRLNLKTLSMKRLQYIIYTVLPCFILLLTACDSNDDLPPIENEEETITHVTLTFTPQGAGAAVEASWVDADGEGSSNPVLSDISLTANTAYTLDIILRNLIDADNPVDITQEVRDEADEHLFFFEWTDGLFTDPSGDGNVGEGQRSDPVNYGDQDTNGLPLGLQTNWTTGSAATGTFRIILSHQPDEKSATSTSVTGDPDVDISWDIVVQ